MPRLDGRQTYQAIRSQPLLAVVPEFMMSAAISRYEHDPSVSAFISKLLVALVRRRIGLGIPAPDMA